VLFPEPIDAGQGGDLGAVDAAVAGGVARVQEGALQAEPLPSTSIVEGRVVLAARGSWTAGHGRRTRQLGARTVAADQRLM
jgi:hypothetical protein